MMPEALRHLAGLSASAGATIQSGKGADARTCSAIVLNIVCVFTYLKTNVRAMCVHMYACVMSRRNSYRPLWLALYKQRFFQIAITQRFH